MCTVLQTDFSQAADEDMDENGDEEGEEEEGGEGEEGGDGEEGEEEEQTAFDLLEDDDVDDQKGAIETPKGKGQGNDKPKVVVHCDCELCKASSKVGRAIHLTDQQG
jgi:hypothetical protein